MVELEKLLVYIAHPFVKVGPDQLILIDESSKFARYEHHTKYALFSVVASCDFSAVASRY